MSTKWMQGLMAGVGGNPASGSGNAVAGMGAAGAAGFGAAGTVGAAASGAAGLGAAGMGAIAGAGGSLSVSGDPCGLDAKPVTGMTKASGQGEVNLQTSGEVEILSVTNTLIVPSKPSPTGGTLFLWPGLQPLKMDQTVGYGVLQPVLTWGSSCAPGPAGATDSWWISGVYVGTTPGSWTNVSCKAGPAMVVSVGDKLDIAMVLKGTVWTQTVTNRSNGKSVSFDYDLKGQKQQWLLHQIELKSSVKPVDDVIFTNEVVKLSASQPNACAPNVKGMNDYFAPPRVSSDGKTCCISKIILRASGIKATSPDTP